MPAYFRFLTILAFHAFLQEEVRWRMKHQDTKFNTDVRSSCEEKPCNDLLVVP